VTVVDMAKHPAEPPEKPETLVDKLGKHKTAPAPIDPTAAVVPEWVRDWTAFQTVALLFLRRALWRTKRFAVQLPVLIGNLLRWSPRGLWRLTALLARYLYDNDSAKVRHQHAGNVETPEYAKAQAIRKANLKARWMVAGSVIVAVAFPVLAWTMPGALAFILATAAFIWTVKLIPGKEFWEFIVAAGIWFVVWRYTPDLLVLFPAPPSWAVLIVAVAAVLALGVLGRPLGKALVSNANLHDGGIPQKPTADMIVDALCRIGLPGMTTERAERVHDEVRIMAPGVATSAHGYTIELELPPGRTAEEVVGKRDKLAGALRRDLGCVWPSGNEDRHPGYTRLFLSHKPMNSAKQPRWPLASCPEVDIFDPLALFTDEQMQWIALTIAGTHTAVGGASGFGKSVWLRQLALAIAMDLRVRLVIIDGKRSGDFEHVRKLAHAFHEGAEDEEIAAQLAELRGLIEECLKRAKFLKGLPPEERSPKVTSALASKYKELRPVVLIYDEVQEGTEYGVKTNTADKKIREEFAGLLTRLARIARSAGVYMVLASQKPDSGVIPSSIMGNCSIRIAFKVSEQVHNDQILGTSARRNGIDATMFGARDRGLAWVKGGDTAAAQVVRSWSEMVDMGLAVELGRRCTRCGVRADGSRAWRRARRPTRCSSPTSSPTAATRWTTRPCPRCTSRSLSRRSACCGRGRGGSSTPTRSARCCGPEGSRPAPCGAARRARTARA
jgi:S-DNA-T family DNA segregation ATPase FtsK/SpoIIIE